MTNTPTNELKKQEESCVFCEKIARRDYLQETAGCVIFKPLNPVTTGHLLIVSKEHIADMGENLSISAKVMRVACLLAKGHKNCNIITSKGVEATQTIRHLHVHIIPRREDDDLLLPWSNQSEKSILEGQLK